MRAPKVWTPHTVTVAPYRGEGPNGPVVGPTVTITGVYVKDTSEVVVTDSGTEEVSRSTVWMPLSALPPTDSRVTVWEGTPQEYEARVFRTARLDHPHWPNFGKVWLR